MNNVFCQVKHNPPESYGDCIRACVASILDRDDVPHSFDGRPANEAWQELRDYLKPLGFTLFVSALDDSYSLIEVFEHMRENNPDAIYMLLAGSGGADHCVVCKGHKIVHNPAWAGQPINKPHSSGMWIIIAISKI